MSNPRPPVGFVVEGACEYVAYENIIRKGVRASHGKMPIINAHGYTNILVQLEEHLMDLTNVSHPHAILVTLDKRDPLRDGHFESCELLRKTLQARADAWLAQSAGAFRACLPLPTFVKVVVQVETFEHWLAADVVGLRAAAPIRRTIPLHRCDDVDSELDAIDYLQRACKSRTNLKHGDFVGPVSRCLAPQRIAASSRSFRKFWKEVTLAYEEWRAAAEGDFELLG